ncbi:MAG: Uma2 family endonuclease [Dehalococcoidia bacterium]|nr:Uma2 family endonuclease [Dehalococcoidia bacterium]
MVTTAKEQLLTAEEFAQLPDDPPDWRMELACGRVEMTPPPGGRHRGVTITLGAALDAFVARENLGRVVSNTGFVLHRGPDIVRAPDVAVVTGGSELPSGYVEGAPALAVEVVSPSDGPARLLPKVAEYLAAGCQRVWLVYPAQRRVVVHYEDGRTDTLEAGSTLTSDHAGFAAGGFELPVARLF